MARSKSPAPQPPQPKNHLSPAQLETGIDRLQARIDELINFDISSIPGGSSPELSALSAAITDTLERCFGEGTSAFSRFVNAADLQFRSMIFTDDYPLVRHYQQGAREKIAKSIALLKVAQSALQEDLKDATLGFGQRPLLSKPKLPSNKVFVVHGHDEAAKQSLARFLERIELEAVILSEMPDQGRTIIEKFEAYAGEVGFAVVLLTPDDLVMKPNGKGTDFRARQNVVFELGYFAGRLGRGKTCLLRKGDIEIPSDLYGVIYTELDTSEGWKVKLVKEMKAAGLNFDANKVWD